MIRYIGNCTAFKAEEIHALRENAKRITWRTFRQRTRGAKKLFEDLGGMFDATNAQVEGSNFFAFYRSNLHGRLAYYAVWSGYEWVWMESTW